MTSTGSKPISSDRLLASLKEAASWPRSNRNTVVTLALALEIIAPGLLRHSESSELAELRQAVLVRLMEQHQSLDPFGLTVYAQLTGAEFPPVA